MSKSKRGQKGLKLLLAANVSMFFMTLTVASVATLIALQPRDAGRTSEMTLVDGSHAEIHKELDRKYAHLLRQAKAAIQEKDALLQEVRAEMLSGYVVSKDIEVTDSNQAYWLSEPKLMLGVTGLSGGSLQISFADRTELISVGERIDFRVEDCDCFLLLKSSRFGEAHFRYACAPTTAT